MHTKLNSLIKQVFRPVVQMPEDKAYRVQMGICTKVY